MRKKGEGEREGGLAIKTYLVGVHPDQTRDLDLLPIPNIEQPPASLDRALIDSHVRELAEFPFFQLEGEGDGWQVFFAEHGDLGFI
jgi:hypothetical protein